MKVTIEVEPRRIADLMVSAFEGGSNYWLKGARLVYPTSVKASPWYDDPAVFEAPSFCMVLTYWPDEDQQETKDITIRKRELQEGLQAMAAKQSRHMGDFLDENDDAETADVFLQCCAFGEVIYG